MKITLLILRVSLAFAFLYPAISGFFSPFTWIGYFPSFLLDTFPQMVLLYVFGVFEILLAIWILSGWKSLYANIIAIFMLLAIVLFNLSQFSVLFRDLVIIAIPVSIILLDRNKTI